LLRFANVLLERARKRNSRLILALDIRGMVNSRIERAEKMLDSVSEDIAGVKINFHLILPFGLEGIKPILRYCREKEIPTIADIKLNDIGSTNEEVAFLMSRYGFDAIIANPIVGFIDGLQGLVKLSHEGKLGLLLLVYMSHKGTDESYSLKFSKGRHLYTIFADRARKWKVDGVIVSSRTTRIIREVKKSIGNECLIVTPGIGAQGGNAVRAITSGSDFIIVGRSIIDSNNPARMSEFYKTAAPFYKSDTINNL
jgi:orotidine-5'-phosphate decarboxylase